MSSLVTSVVESAFIGGGGRGRGRGGVDRSNLLPSGAVKLLVNSKAVKAAEGMLFKESNLLTSMLLYCTAQ